jgi:benzodiazapine receptor
MINTLVPDVVLFFYMLALCMCSMLVGALAMTQTGEKAVYKKLNKPPWAPPGWAFGPVWIILYTLFAFSMWLLNRDRIYDHLITENVLAYVLLALLAVWTWMFFRFNWKALALFELLAALAIAIAVTVLFSLKDLTSGLLFIPLDVWLIVAGTLNFYALSN